ncbi:phosphohexomutase domain-containing protein [Haploplasma axanthum]|nr:phosphoglucosamine mutase [Haploplasma axanthum]
MKPEFFGTDGLRGVGFTDLNAKLAYNLGQGLKEALKSDTVVIGMDTRDSSPMLAHMVAAGALSVGMDVLFAGVVSTPMIAHYSKLKQIAGIMITASHNPYTDNGIKVFSKGYKSNVEEELIIESYIKGKVSESDFEGNFSITDDVEKEYLKLIKKLDLKKSNIKLVYDSANGANHLIASKVMKEYFPLSIQINNEPNGKNINLNSGSTHLESIKDFILKNKMDLGFAYDGDGDRVIMLDNNGTIYDGDFIIYIVGKYLKKLKELKGNHVVLTKMSNPGILKALNNSGINYVLTDVGDKYVHKALVDNDYVIGGEASGHIILRHILHSGDGLLASLYILKMLEEENITLSDAVKDVNLYPLKMVNIKNVNKNILHEQEVIDYLDKIKSEFDKEDIFLVRASGTENLIRVTISCLDLDKLNKYMDEVVSFIEQKGQIK